MPDPQSILPKNEFKNAWIDDVAHFVAIVVVVAMDDKVSIFRSWKVDLE
jgi:hypothetical protein